MSEDPLDLLAELIREWQAVARQVGIPFTPEDCASFVLDAGYLNRVARTQPAEETAGE